MGRVLTLREAGSHGFSRERAGVGSSAQSGDYAFSVLDVPPAPTLDEAHRYLLRLAAFSLLAGDRAYVYGYKTAWRIGLDVGTPDAPRPLRHTIVDPFWGFPQGGNVTFQPRYIPGNIRITPPYDAAQVPPNSTNVYGIDTGLLYQPPLLPYVPPQGGVPPGVPIGGVYDIYDSGNTWTNPNWNQRYEICGPGTAALFATVWQPTAPAPVIVTTAPYDVGSLPPDDRFLNQNPGALIVGVAGAIMWELVTESLCPTCGECHVTTADIVVGDRSRGCKKRRATKRRKT